MRAIVQRVTRASVTVEGHAVGALQRFVKEKDTAYGISLIT